MDVVLAGADMGRTAGGIRGQPEPGPGLRDQWFVAGSFHAGGECGLRSNLGASYIRNFSAGALFSGGRIFFAPAAFAHRIQQKDIQAYDPAPDVYDGVVYCADAKPANKDSAPAGISHQVRLGNAVVQYLDVARPMSQNQNVRLRALLLH